MDLVADVLNSIPFKGTVYCQAEFTAPWGVTWEGRPARAGFFMVVRGGCYMEFVGAKAPLALAPGDFVMSPRARGYTLRDSLESETKRFDDVLLSLGIGEQSIHRSIQYGGGGCPTKLIMGCFELDTNGSNPFLQSLPEFIYIRSEDLQSEPWLETTLRFLAAECANGKLGSLITSERLTELIFVQAIRVYIGNQQVHPNKSGWLRAVSDLQIGRALSLIHESPQAPWTVATLADSVAMSRSSFAAKFKELTDVTPLDYVTSWRMHKAQALLANGSLNLSEIAEQVGYHSEAAFSKAFKRETGHSPGNFRKK
jgi:AraC family transcriptional regulator, alkane utilization regulator